MDRRTGECSVERTHPFSNKERAWLVVFFAVACWLSVCPFVRCSKQITSSTHAHKYGAVSCAGRTLMFIHPAASTPTMSCCAQMGLSFVAVTVTQIVLEISNGYYIPQYYIMARYV